MLGRVFVASLGLTSFLVTASLAQRAAEVPPLCCDVPAADTCIARVSYFGKGSIRAGASHQSLCKEGKVTLATATLLVRLERSQSCDEGRFPALMMLRATGRLVRRADGFAHFHGTAVLTNSTGTTTLMTGSLEFFERLGSHHATPIQRTTCEACDQKQHLEGPLDLCGQGKTSAQRLHALVTGTLQGTELSTALTLGVDGGLLTPP